MHYPKKNSQRPQEKNSKILTDQASNLEVFQWTGIYIEGFNDRTRDEKNRDSENLRLNSA